MARWTRNAQAKARAERWEWLRVWKATSVGAADLLMDTDPGA